MANEWNTGYPIDHTLASAVPGEIRKLKDSVKDQLSHEHQAPVDGDETGTEHSNGSAVAFEGTSTPTTRPGGAALADNAIDRGRLWLDDNYDPPRPKRWKGNAFEDVGVPGFVYSGQTVFNGTMDGANAWQTLDLSSYIGARRALCFLQVLSDDNCKYALSPQETGTIKWHSYCSSASQVDFTGTPGNAYLITMTHSDGTLKHGCSSTARTINVVLLGYIAALRAS